MSKVNSLKAYWLVAAVALAVTGRAYALPPSDYNSTPGDTLDVFVSGSSAQDPGLELLVRVLCDADTLDIYRDLDPSKSSQRVFFCKASAAKVPGFPAAGQKVAIFKTSVGGSGNGVGPVIRTSDPASMLKFIDMNFLKSQDPVTGGCSTNTLIPASGIFGAYENHEGCPTSTTQSQLPDAGVSDVEPALFVSIFTPPLAGAELNTLTVKSASAVIFGVPVTQALRDALQQVQLGPACVGKETELCMPSLTRDQLNSIYTGTLTDWGQMEVKGTATPLPAAPGVSPPSDTKVYVVRRVDTSGTQVSFNVFYSGTLCGIKGARSFLVDNSGGVCTQPPTGTVFAGSKTGDARTCLNTHNTNNRWAVGILSTESVFNKDPNGNPLPTPDGWRFIKVDDQAPTLFKTATSHYPFFSEQSIQWRNATSPMPLTGLKLKLMTTVATKLGQPPIVAKLNTIFVQSFGGAGLLSLSTNGYTVPDPLTAAALKITPVNPMTKVPTGTKPVNCQPPVLATGRKTVTP